SNLWIAPTESTAVRDSLEDEAPVRFAAVPDPELYATDAFWPRETVRVLSRGVVRDTDYALVQVIPFQWNPVRRVLRVYDQREASDLRRVLANLNPAAIGEAWKIEIDRDGLYRVAQADLMAAGFPASVDPTQLKLELRGQPVPIRVLDNDNDGRFDAGDEILF